MSKKIHLNLLNRDSPTELLCVCVFCPFCSSIHDHTDSHCFMKLLQGQLKETLFEWPSAKTKGDMVQKSQRVLQENQVAYINGEQSNPVLYGQYPYPLSINESLHCFIWPLRADYGSTFMQRKDHTDASTQSWTFMVLHQVLVSRPITALVAASPQRLNCAFTFLWDARQALVMNTRRVCKDVRGP